MMCQNMFYSSMYNVTIKHYEIALPQNALYLQHIYTVRLKTNNLNSKKDKILN